MLGKGTSLVSFKNLHDYVQFANTLPELLFDNRIVSVMSAEIMGTVYKPNMVLAFDIIHDLPAIGRIKYIIVNDNNNVCFIFELLETLFLNDHNQGYRVTVTDTMIFSAFDNVYLCLLVSYLFCQMAICMCLCKLLFNKSVADVLCIQYSYYFIIKLAYKLINCFYSNNRSVNTWTLN
jgi:hypothetical protein